MNKPPSELIALADKCRELLEWHRTGILVDGEVRKLAATLGAPTTMEHTKLHIAETQIAAEAMEAVVRTAANQSGSERAGVDALREALRPFAKMAGAMYVSGHCGGASPEDWPDHWHVTVQGGKHFHTPQQHGGYLTVADFRRAAEALATPPAQPAPASDGAIYAAVSAASMSPDDRSAIDDHINKKLAPLIEFDPYGEAEQWGMKYALEIFGKHIAGVEDWEGGDGSETVDGDLLAEFDHIARAAGWVNADGDPVFGPSEAPSTGYQAVHITLGDFRRAADALHSPKIAATETSPGDVWRCFHCDEVFTDRDVAKDHFGYDMLAEPGCKLNAIEGGLLGIVRRQEERLDAYHREDTASYREFYSLGADHWTALRREEEKGYARGLADCKKDCCKAAIDRLDVKAEAKSQEPEAMAMADIIDAANEAQAVIDVANHLNVPTIREALSRGFVASYASDGDYRLEIKFKTLDEMQSARTALHTRPTTKPEAPSVSVDAIRHFEDRIQKYVTQLNATGQADVAHLLQRDASALISAIRDGGKQP